MRVRTIWVVKKKIQNRKEEIHQCLGGEINDILLSRNDILTGINKLCDDFADWRVSCRVRPHVGKTLVLFVPLSRGTLGGSIFHWGRGWEERLENITDRDIYLILFHDLSRRITKKPLSGRFSPS